jgi:hypothetical protein
MDVSVRFTRDQAYAWRLAKLQAKEEGIYLSELLVKAIVKYCMGQGPNSNEHVQSVST